MIQQAAGRGSDGHHAAEGVTHTWPSPVLIDAHTHLYDCYPRSTYFDSTLANIRRAKARLGLYTGCDPALHTPACLLLAEPVGMHAFESVRDQGTIDGGRWRFNPCADGLSLIAQHDGLDELVLIAGRQIKTHEHLEVLSLCCDRDIPDGLTTVQTLELAMEAGGLTVLPLGAGKWLGSRGRIVDDLLRGPLGEKLCLGDNAGRLAVGPTPRQFTEANKRGIWVLPGSGALPFRSQATRGGRYGLVLPATIDRATPAADIVREVRSLTQQPTIYGRPDGLWGYLRLQTAMQVYNLINGS